MVLGGTFVGSLFVQRRALAADTQDGSMINWPQLSQLEWNHPWCALLALQPLLMALLLRLRRKQVMYYADAHLLAWVVRGSLGGKQGVWSRVINLAAWILLACALAGPRLPLVSNNGQQAAQRHEMDIMVILDVSPSMQAQDISPQRLQRAKLELLDLLPRLHGERLGLIAFSGSAAQIMPLSRDYAALRYYLQIAEPALFDAPGSAIAGALELAMRKLAEKKYGDNSGDKSANRAILLLSDAENSALSGPAGAAVMEAADKLAGAGIRLYILGVGTAAGATIPQANGNTLVDEGVEVVSRMDETGFAELAQKTRGKFVAVEDGDGDWRSLYDNGLLTLAGGRQAAENVQAWQELYAVFLLPALLLFVILYFPFRLKKARLAVTASLLIVVSAVAGIGVHDAHASETDAYDAYRNHNHALAQTLYGDLQGYAARMGEGAAAYRRKDYQYAIRQFSTALLESRDARQREQALFNLGNSYFIAGGYRAAADAFLGVLKYAPDNQDARANLALAAGKLAETSKAGKKSQGILGRRGRGTGGDLGDDASDKPVSLEPSDEKKDKSPGHGSELQQGEIARLLSSEKQSAGNSSSAQSDSDIAYRAALKKLELAADSPAAMHKALVKIEAAREYMPQPEMPPW
jgi:Ca-activated chloride channel family protein